jgi:ATP-dependent DNA helicase RecG
VQFVRRRGFGSTTGATEERQQVTGPLVEVVDRLVGLINAPRPGAAEAMVALRREPVPPYPPEALREGLLNALGHRDYALTGATVDVTVWDDRLEIRSPGSLPGHMTLDNLRAEHYSRNPRIMTVLKTMRLVEEYGEGVDRLYEQMAVRLLPDPSWSANPSSVTLLLQSTSEVSVEDQIWLSMLSNLDLTPPERRVLLLARQRESITRRLAAAAVPIDAAGSLLAGMVVKGLLQREGERGGTTYRLSDEVVARAGASGHEAQTRKRQRLREHIARRGSISVAEGAGLLGEPPPVVRALLKDLVTTGEAAAFGNTRARRYHAL